MKLFLIFLTLMCVTDSQAQIQRNALAALECSDTDKEYLSGTEGEVLFYADFEKKKGVNMLPPFADPIDFPGVYESAEANMAVCESNLEVFIIAFKDQPIPQDAPQSSIYPRDDIQLGSANTLICHSARFFPPPVRVRWTKNNKDVTDQSTLSQYYPNKDYTYNQFSHLPFTPQKGDVYTCTVEHKALVTPDTKTWKVDVAVPSVFPSVFFGVGVALGLLGIATGTFFLIKGSKCN